MAEMRELVKKKAASKEAASPDLSVNERKNADARAPGVPKDAGVKRTEDDRVPPAAGGSGKTSIIHRWQSFAPILLSYILRE